jgi:hypothetical protein
MPKGHHRLLVIQKRSLRRDHVQVRVQAGFVPHRRFLQRAAGRFGSCILLVDILAQNPQRCQIVLDLLERGERSLLIVGYGLVIGRAVLLDGRLRRPASKMVSATLMWNPDLFANSRSPR